jgi:hypothetical protein
LQDLTCTYTNGSDKNTKYFHRDGERDGSRTGTREGTRTSTREGTRTAERDGTRTGSQSGKQVGSIATDLNVTDKKTGQYTGFNLKGFTGTPVYSPVGEQVWDAPSFDTWEFGPYNFGAYTFGAAQFTGGYSFGDYTFAPDTTTAWGEWDAAPGENPADCLRSEKADHITRSAT